MAEHGEPDDETLLLAWRAGDRRAGSILMARHYHRIARFFCARHRPDWDELTQSTFLGCIEGMQRFRGEASFATFLFAIAHKKLLKQLRDQSRDERRATAAAEVDDASMEAPTSPSEAPDALRQHVLASLWRLPDDTQVMLQLHYWENTSIRAIAARFELPEGTVKARLHRARQQILAECAGLDGASQKFEIIRGALEIWADHEVRECGNDDAVNPARHATTPARREQPDCHEEQNPRSSQPVPRRPGRDRGVRGYRV
jgi:RNA polymerase sigma factor (sigma-70 family)